jgi:hypothetical protein
MTGHIAELEAELNNCKDLIARLKNRLEELENL